MSQMTTSATLSSARLPPLPVGEQVYRVVRAAIVSLTMLPNERISENTLVAQIGVSRTPIREALQRLEREGLVVIQPQRGTYVAPLDMQAIRSAYFARLALECAVAREAATRRNQADISALQAEIEAQEAVRGGTYTESSGFDGLNHRFHALLRDIADLSGLHSLIDNAMVQLVRVRVAHLAYADPYPLAPLVDQHKAIVAAITDGDPAAADLAMRGNIEPVLPRLELLQRKRPDFFHQPRDPSRPLWAVKAPEASDTGQ